jgi:hypothetical protein
MHSKGIARGIYRHYKGAEVEVIGTALHSETLEELVIYRHLTGEHAGETHYWVRPLAMFMEHIQTEKGAAPRFEYLRDSDTEPMR